MAKTASNGNKRVVGIVLLCVIVLVTLFFGVCSCLPDGLEYGDYNVYHAAINLLQGDSMFEESVVTTYKLKLDEGANVNDVLSIIRSRLGHMYGRWFCSVTESNGVVTVKVPKTANKELSSADSILSNVTVTGKVEILTSSTYSEDDVILTSDHIAGMRTNRITSGTDNYYIVEMRLNKEGKAIASEKLKASSSGANAYLAIDGTVSFAIVYGTNGKMQVFTSSDAQCQYVIGLIRSGSLPAKLTSIDTDTVSSNGGLIFAIVMAVVLLAIWIFFLVRYKALGLAPVISQLIAVVVFIMFSGMVYFSLLNIASVIGILLGCALMTYFTVVIFDKLVAYLADDKTFASARHRSFRETTILLVIVHAIALVLGIILWVIPTGVTVPLGNALVYVSVLSFVVTIGLNRGLVSLVYSVTNGSTVQSPKSAVKGTNK